MKSDIVYLTNSIKNQSSHKMQNITSKMYVFSFLVFISGAAEMLKFMDADSNGKFR